MVDVAGNTGLARMIGIAVIANRLGITFAYCEKTYCKDYTPTALDYACAAAYDKSFVEASSRSMDTLAITPKAEEKK